MTDQHRATPKQWDKQKAWAVDDDDSSCILELRTRVEALEAQNETQRQATLEWSGDVLRRIMALEAGQKTSPSPAVDRMRDLRDQIRAGELSLAEALDLGVVPASDVQDAMRRAASKAASKAALEMGGIRKNYTYKAPAAPAPTDSLESTEHAPADSLVERPEAFQTLCAYARNYIKEYGDKSEAYELECIIDLLSRTFGIPFLPPEATP